MGGYGSIPQGGEQALVQSFLFILPAYAALYGGRNSIFNRLNLGLASLLNSTWCPVQIYVRGGFGGVIYPRGIYSPISICIFGIGSIGHLGLLYRKGRHTGLPLRRGEPVCSPFYCMVAEIRTKPVFSIQAIDCFDFSIFIHTVSYPD